MTGRFGRRVWQWVQAVGSQAFRLRDQILGRRLGDAGEQAAEHFLKRLGYRILARQHRSDLGEIDLIALDGETIVFVEVKTRRSLDAGSPVDAVDRRKQQQLTRLALAYLRGRHWLERRARFDIVAIVWVAGESPDIRHFINAFEPPGRGQMYS